MVDAEKAELILPSKRLEIVFVKLKSTFRYWSRRHLKGWCPPFICINVLVFTTVDSTKLAKAKQDKSKIVSKSAQSLGRHGIWNLDDVVRI